MGWREALRQTPQGFAEFYMVDFMDSVQNSSLYHFLPPRSNPRIWGEEDLEAGTLISDCLTSEAPASNHVS